MKCRSMIQRDAYDPWMYFAGAWKDDPDWDTFEEGMRLFREEMDCNADDIVFDNDRKFNEVLLWNS